MASAFAVGLPAAAVAATLPSPGNACFFNAPNGVVNGGLIGHIGWAFRTSTGSWVFGAAEQSGQLWMSSGSWAQVLAAFGQGSSPYPKGPGYYMSYRCENVGASNPTYAYNEAYTETHNGYDLLKNNCLTKSIRILRAYDATNLPDGTITNLPSNLPNYYYEHLPSGFSAAVSLTTATIGVQLIDPVSKSYINTHPVHTKRPLTVLVYDATNTLIYQTTVTATVVPGTDRYVATVPLDRTRNWSLNGATVAQFKVKLDYTLYRYAPGIYFINQGVDNAVSDTQLIVGDVNQDNVVNTTDYNLMMQCYSDLLPPKGPCPTTSNPNLKRASDLNDDGYVNGIDYNLMLRIIQNQGGG